MMISIFEVDAAEFACKTGYRDGICESTKMLQPKNPTQESQESKDAPCLTVHSSYRTQ